MIIWEWVKEEVWVIRWERGKEGVWVIMWERVKEGVWVIMWESVKEGVWVIMLERVNKDEDPRKQGLTFFEEQFSIFVSSVTSNVFLKICMFMVVHSDTFISCRLCQPFNQTGFTNRSLTLDKHWMLSAKESYTLIVLI